MPSLDLVFFILRHVDTYEDGLLWKACYESVRKFYPDTMVVVLDNGSNQEIVDMIAPDEYSVIHQSELPNGRLFVPYYYYLTQYANYKKAVILHDSTILQSVLPVETVNHVKYLWHFETHDYDDIHTGTMLLSHLQNAGPLYDLYMQKQWHGCLGCICVITQSFLQRLQDKYSILSLKDVITSKAAACEFERILSVLCTYECPELAVASSASLFGDISTLEWGLRYNTYMANRESYAHYTVVKLFAAR
jgi:hypothetical protein